MINLELFMVISLSQFDSLVDSLGLTLSHSADTYMITYLTANLLAYAIIFAFISSVIFLYRQLFSKKRRSWL